MRRDKQEEMHKQESLKSAQQSHKQQQDHPIVSSHSQNTGVGHLHHSVVQNDLKLGLGMGGGISNNLGMMGSLEKTNQDLLKAVNKLNVNS